MNPAATIPDPFEELITALRRDGLISYADELHETLRETGRPTGAELPEELALKLHAIGKEITRQCSEETRSKLKAAERLAKRSRRGVL